MIIVIDSRYIDPKEMREAAVSATVVVAKPPEEAYAPTHWTINDAIAFIPEPHDYMPPFPFEDDYDEDIAPFDCADDCPCRQKGQK